MPRRLSQSPKITDFVPLKEYVASTPASFALEENAVLYLDTQGTVSGVAAGPAHIWIASDGLHFWQSTQQSGFLVPYRELILHAIQTDPPALYLQLQGEQGEFDYLELRFTPQAPVSHVYKAVSSCIELYPHSEASETNSVSGSALDRPFPASEIGQGDDELYSFEDDELEPASAALQLGVLGKSRRRSDDFDHHRTHKILRE